MKHETAGDPISGLKWTHKTTEKIAKQLARLDIKVSPKTVARLLKGKGYSLRVNHKKIESGIKNPPPREVRDQQFEYISQMREAFARGGNPIISVDTKKKEMVGNFKNNGTSWEEAPYQVKDHDFPSDADGRAIPYSIYDTLANLGFVVVGTSHETPAFAVESIVLWWRVCAQKRYPTAKALLILADCGGGNSARSRAWKYHLANQLCVPYNVTVTVCHYPPGASKWNPVDHRLHPEISKNWAGKPLVTYDTVMNYIRTTKTDTGLRVQARLVRKQYAKGEKISDAEMALLPIIRHKNKPEWNYTLKPPKM
jgi:hypothetical protein